MKSKYLEVSALFILSLLMALMCLMATSNDTAMALISCVISAALGISAFWVIFADIYRTQKLFGNQAVEPK